MKRYKQLKILTKGDALCYIISHLVLRGNMERTKYGRELLKGNTDSLILSLIGHQPMYGYQLIKEMEKRSGGYFQFREGTLYPALHRMEGEGLIAGKWEQLPSGQERRYYHLTEKGHRVLNEKLAVWRSFSAAVNLIIEPATSA